MRAVPSGVLILLAAPLLACGGRATSATGSDAGTGGDAGTGADAGTDVDGLPPPPADAGPPPANGGRCVYIDPSAYDRSCRTDTDCVDVTAGWVCLDLCQCGGSSIKATERARYDKDTASVEPGAVCFGCPPDGYAACVGGTCTYCGGTSLDPPGCPDGG